MLIGAPPASQPGKPDQAFRHRPAIGCGPAPEMPGRAASRGYRLPAGLSTSSVRDEGARPKTPPADHRERLIPWLATP